MNKVQNVFLTIVGDILSERKIEDPSLSAEEWKDLFSLAQQQTLFPLVYDAVYSCPSCETLPADLRNVYKQNALQQAVQQIMQTNETLNVILQLQKKGIDPLIVKGMICRNLYARAFLRTSVDEDFLLEEQDFDLIDEQLQTMGLYAEDSGDPGEKSFRKKDSPLYIEVHRELFSSGNDLICSMNDLFAGSFDRSVRANVQDASIRTLCPQDHLLYLILHAFKHFLYSGSGIRPLCDIGLYVKEYGNKIDWEKLRRDLSSVNAYDYACASFQIIREYLLKDASFLDYLSDRSADTSDVEPLLEDILASGIHGASSLTRLHSSNITLNAVSRKDTASSLLTTLFPPLSNMEGRYPYLKKRPYLLPLAWSQRIFTYLKETKTTANNDPGQSIQLGKERVKLLKKYGIVEK